MSCRPHQFAREVCERLAVPTKPGAAPLPIDEVLGFRNAPCRGGQGRPGTWVWIGVEDVAALHAEYQASGAIIRHPP